MLGMTGQQVFCLLITLIVVTGAVVAAWAPPSRRKNQAGEGE